jgi:GR25 family glycosyltransferase involved in LPS biosynthesis
MKLNEYFDKIYCINLDRRTDRWEECQKIFSKHGLEVERFSAIDGSKENYGLGYPYDNELAGAISHTKVIEKARELKLKNVLILEDDVDFIGDLEKLFTEFIKETPQNWDGLLFGGNHVGGGMMVTKNLMKVNRSYALHSYGLNFKVFNETIGYMNSRIQNVIDNGKEVIKTSVAADFFMADLHRINNWYCFRPHLAWQRTGFSDIQNTVMDYDFLRK